MKTSSPIQTSYNNYSNNSVYQEAIKKLNPNQLEAVQSTEGVVVINAGPGTGKSEVLSLRIANILSVTDTDPRNILCLTYTEAASTNMKNRLTKYLASDAYKVSIFTFHSFATDIINHYPKYFFGGIRFNPIDNLSQYKILQDIFKSLPLSFKTSSFHPSKGYTYISDAITVIGNIKKEGFNYKQYFNLLTLNKIFLTRIESDLIEIFEEATFTSKNKNWEEQLANLANKVSTILQNHALSDGEINQYFNNSKTKFIQTHANIAKFYFDKLQSAVQESILTAKSTPFTNYKKSIIHTINGKKKLAELESLEIQFEIAHIYNQYEQVMHSKAYFDFSDMLLEVIDALQNVKNVDLVSALQEKYQYVLIDEYQDTNGSQLQLVELILNNNQNPNLLVVGDTDQTIYKFQGASSGNLEQIKSKYPSCKTINLFQNYRSNQKILDFAQHLISKSKNRNNEDKQSLISMV